MENYIEFKVGESVGEIKLGMTASDVVPLLGPPSDRKYYDNNEVLFLTYDLLGIQLTFDLGILVNITAFSGRTGGYQTKSFNRCNIKTDKGITMDSKKDDIIKAYGKPLLQGDLPHPPIPTEWMSYRGIYFEYIKDTQELISISCSDPKEIGYIYCIFFDSKVKIKYQYAALLNALKGQYADNKLCFWDGIIDKDQEFKELIKDFSKPIQILENYANLNKAVELNSLTSFAKSLGIVLIFSERVISTKELHQKLREIAILRGDINFYWGMTEFRMFVLRNFKRYFIGDYKISHEIQLEIKDGKYKWRNKLLPDAYMEETGLAKKD